MVKFFLFFSQFVFSYGFIKVAKIILVISVACFIAKIIAAIMMFMGYYGNRSD